MLYICVCVCVCVHTYTYEYVLVTQSCPALCDPKDYSPPSRILCPWDFPGKTTGLGCLSLLQYMSAAAAKSLQSCPTLCDLTDGSPPGSPVPGILQARTLEWVAISFSNE